eukprot:CAMPEP_0176186100 /NCGR_PEP_ID=MMETSP0121_2-20121125/1693_1 /TAXON_ID=160619 /ORGANISM="Kryptoperidinium foliaceum, Strain CCMP 1326" /LENGTH=846 /DNA_ID=CAMNT_0017524569 /DNA_START=185 /DNA_END=2725 /DNA_ORIENTATION=+
MARQGDWKEGDASEGNGAAAARDANPGGAVAHMQPPFNTNTLQALSNNQQFSFLDPNVLMMTNAAATIAAVAASAVQQMNQGSSAPAPPVGNGGAASAFTPALLAQVRNAVAAQASSGAAVSPQIAALLAAVGGGGGNHGLQLHGANGAGNHGLQLPAASSSSATIASHLHRLLHNKETPKIQPPPPQAPTSLPLGAASSPSHSGMQNWKAEQLEKHVSLLKQMNQPIPQSVALLLADAQRRDKKKTAKRAANRKSASTSRARKKALVEEMTLTNARLKRQALILALLPDLVIATSLDGEVTFCSAQVERILGHKPGDLVGVQLDKVLVPSSRDTLQKLFKRLVTTSTRSSRQAQNRRGTKRRHDEQKEAGEKSDSKDDEGDGKGGNDAPGRGSLQSGDANSGNSGTNSGGAALISETSFPLSVVEVESKQQQQAEMPEKNTGTEAHENTNNANENSDNSTSNNSGSKQRVSSLSNSQSPIESPSEDDGARGDAKKSKRAKTAGKGKDQTSSGDDSSSSLSSKAENMRKANDNLDRNVRWHNQRMMGDSQKAKSDDGPKDDVTGASVTANNASARLSSLKHYPSPAVKKSEKPTIRYENDQLSSDDSLLAGVEEKKDTSDDSGYRESNDSREETSSSGSDSSNIKKRRKPLAPTVRLCLIRQDLTTVWCEVTSSMRTRTPEEDPIDLQLDSMTSPDSIAEESAVKNDPVQEFLLCFRPMRDGDKKADDSLRLVTSRAANCEDCALVSSSGNDDSNSTEKVNSDKTSAEGSDSKNNSASSDDVPTKRPPKKRPLDINLTAKGAEGSSPAKKLRSEGAKGDSQASDDTEKSVIESLIMIKSHGVAYSV